MSDNSDKTQKIAIFLHKDTVQSFEDCIKVKARDSSDIHAVKNSIGISGKIYIHHFTVKPPEWKTTLEKLTSETISLNDNSSNKAVVVFKYKNRYLSLTYGYGKSMLDEDTIERNFGLIVAANLIDPKKIRSLNSMTIEDTIVDTQKQAVNFSTQENFQINQNSEILKSVSGAPNLETTAKFIVGSDSITATQKMNIENVKEFIKFYYDTYQKNDYIDKGFGWLNNIKRLKDTAKNDLLNSKLEQDILHEENNIVVGPNKILDWEDIAGFYITGMRNSKEPDISISLDYEKYLAYLRAKPEMKFLDKLKRDKIKAVNDQGIHFSISSVYDGIVYELSHDDKRYLLCYGDWYEVDEDFYKRIRERVGSAQSCELVFPSCNKVDGEGKYNLMVEESNENYFSLDKQNYSIPGHGSSRVEPCDILTKDKKFVHVKKGGSSSTLSHLFAQGLVAARLLSNDVGFRDHVNNKVSSKFGADFIKSTDKNNNFEIVYAIIDHRHKELVDTLPFFSLVNLAQTLDQLEAMDYNYSLMKIDVSDE